MLYQALCLEHDLTLVAMLLNFKQLQYRKKVSFKYIIEYLTGVLVISVIFIHMHT
jgi:hypothetical protein